MTNWDLIGYLVKYPARADVYVRNTTWHDSTKRADVANSIELVRDLAMEEPDDQARVFIDNEPVNVQRCIVDESTGYEIVLISS